MTHPNAQSDVILHARVFAVTAHGDQRYGDQPYTAHLDAVAELLQPYGEVAQVVAYLHDVVEDTQLTAERIAAAFGDHVARCVRLVTDEPGTDRGDRKIRTNAKLSKVDAGLQLALVVKAADRLANLRTSIRGGNFAKLEMYRLEHAAFREAAFRPGLCDELWAEMERILSHRSSNA